MTYILKFGRMQFYTQMYKIPLGINEIDAAFVCLLAVASVTNAHNFNIGSIIKPRDEKKHSLPRVLLISGIHSPRGSEDICTSKESMDMGLLWKCGPDVNKSQS